MAMTNEMIDAMMKATVGVCSPAGYDPNLNAGALNFIPMDAMTRPQLAQPYDHKPALIECLMRENGFLQDQIKCLSQTIERLTRAEEAKGDPLVDQVENVIKGVLGGKVPARKVDELGDAVTRNKSDRAVIRNLGR